MKKTVDPKMERNEIKVLARNSILMFFIVAEVLFLFSYWMSTVPPASEVSLSLAFRPWWRCVSFATEVSFFVTLPFAFAFAYDLTQKGRINQAVEPNIGPDCL